MGRDERRLDPYRGPGAVSWVTGADAERERLWSLIETYVYRMADTAYIADRYPDDVPGALAVMKQARAELRQALRFVEG